MKCLACDVILTDNEATRKNEHNEFIDLCNSCTQESFVDVYSDGIIIEENDNE